MVPGAVPAHKMLLEIERVSTYLQPRKAMMIGYSKTDQTKKETRKKQIKPKSIKPGKKTKAWENERAKLKKRFQAVNITSCELRLPGKCIGDFGLGFAHEYKRNELPKGELNRVALACAGCHAWAERLSHDEMYRVVNAAIEARPPHINTILLAP